MKITVKKWKAQLTVILITVLLSVLLLSQADLKGIDKLDKGISRVKYGGIYKTRRYSQWRLYRYKSEKLPKKYPYKYAPWESYVAIDRYVTIGSDRTHNTLTISPTLYKSIKPIADSNKATAKRILRQIKAKGHGLKAYRKIYRYVSSGKYITGKKSTADFFQYHGGDCMAHASAFYVLCKVQNIPVRICIGECQGELHAWNKVKVKGKWWWVDCTFSYPRKKKLWKNHKAPMEVW